MPPVNDNFSTASALPNTDSGSVDGSNVGATTNNGESTPMGGKTVWYKWTAPNVGKPYRFGARRRSFSNRTNFPASLSIFDSNGLLLIIAKRYAQWWDKCETVFTAQGSGQYYIRVGSLTGKGGPLNNGEGDFTLWWERSDQVAELNLFPCNDCGSLLGVDPKTYQTCWQPDIFSKNSLNLSAATATKGFYVWRYCGGSFSFSKAIGLNPTVSWVVGRVPRTEVLQFTENPSGYFIWAEYNQVNKKLITFPEPLPPDAANGDRGGWATPELAQKTVRDTLNGINCGNLVFFHDGGGPLRLRFEDNQYPDNLAWDSGGTPKYALARVETTVLIAGVSSIRRNTPGNYTGQFFILNTSEINPTVQATMTGGGVVSTSFPFVTLAPRAITSVTVDFGISPSTLENFTGVLQLKIGGASVIGLGYDLTPQIRVTTQGIFKVAGKWTVAFVFSSGVSAGKSGLPTIELHATFEETGGVSNIKNAGTNTPQTDFLADNGLGNLTTVNLTFTPSPAGINSVTFTIHLHDNATGLDFPPVVFNLACPL